MAIIGIAIFDGILTVSLYLLLYLLVLRPIRKISNYATKLGTGEAEIGSDLGAGPLPREIDSLKGTVEALVGKLDYRYIELKRNEAMITGILNTIPQGVYWKDLGGNYVGCNNVFANQLGLANAKQVSGKTDKDLIDATEARERQIEDFAVMQTHSPKMHVTKRILTAKGAEIWVDACKVPLIDETGAVYGMLGVYSDMTERIAIEAEIRKANATLEESVRTRTAELENVVKELEAFSYSVSHDLRGPLRSVFGFARILMDDYGPKLDEQARGYLKRVWNAAGRMDQLVDGLLSLSRVSRSELAIENVNLSALAHEVARELSEGDTDRHVEFDIQEGLTSRGDAKLLRPLFANLIGNAWKYTASNELAHIAFGMRQCETGDEYFVSDDGVGFDMKYSSKLFMPFERLHSGEEFAGLGIGLATVDRVVRRHGGSIRAESTPGSGTTFYFKLAPSVTLAA